MCDVVFQGAYNCSLIALALIVLLENRLEEFQAISKIHFGCSVLSVEQYPNHDLFRFKNKIQFKTKKQKNKINVFLGKMQNFPR